jgi:hypothetical protein
MWSWDRPGEVNFFVSWNSHVVLHYTKNFCAKVVYFKKIYFLTSLYGRAISDASVDPTSKFRSSAMLVLLIVGN